MNQESLERANAFLAAVASRVEPGERGKDPFVSETDVQPTDAETADESARPAAEGDSLRHVALKRAAMESRGVAAR